MAKEPPFCIYFLHLANATRLKANEKLVILAGWFKMVLMIAKIAFDQILSRIRIGGVVVDYWGSETKTYGPEKPYFKLTINDPKAIGSILKSGDLGFGEAYAAGQIEVDGSLDLVMRLVFENSAAIDQFGRVFRKFGLQRNTKDKQAEQIQHHYDLGNDFYELWLDKSMTYTCAYFKSAKDSLEQAQEQKLDHVIRKLQLKPGHKFVDMGCGWGHLVVRAAKLYGAEGLGVTLSREQFKYATELAKTEGVEKLAKFELLNYQDLPARKVQYDRVISVGLGEHVGRGNHKQYFKVVDQLLKPGGISVMHTITHQDEEPIPRWLDKHIFPGGYIPSIRELVGLLPDYGFRLQDYENLRIHYAMTLDHWLERFDAHRDWVVNKYSEEFYRMWRFYLAGSSGSFRYGDNDLSQLVFTKGNNNDLPLTREHLYPKP